MASIRAKKVSTAVPPPPFGTTPGDGNGGKKKAKKMAKKHGDVKKKVNKKVVRKRKAGERSATRGAPSAYVWWTPVSEIVVGDFVILEHSGRNAEVVGVTVRDTVPTGIVLDMEAEHGASGKVVEDKSKLYENPTQRIDVVRATEPPAGYIRSGVK